MTQLINTVRASPLGVGRKTVVIIVGPTAVGKTGVAIELARHFQTEIISADSRQCFKELVIGVARPSVDELMQVKHHFIATHSIREEMNAVVFENYALEKANSLFRDHDTVIMTGGTGLYIKAFIEGLDEIATVKPEIRNRISSAFNKMGLAWLQEEIKLKDPEFYKTGEIQNPQRLMRALEVVESTGFSILSFRKGPSDPVIRADQKTKRDFNIITIGLELSKEDLHRNINTRVDAMMGRGLLEEVKQLAPDKDLNALQTVGYAEIFDFLDGKILLPNAIERIKTTTRQYAKRQMTWFKKDKNMPWFRPGEVKKIIEFTS